MKATSTLKVVHRLIIEKPQLDPAFADTELHAFESRPSGDLQDNYDYYPDFGI
jgi:hypothetical protein